MLPFRTSLPACLFHGLHKLWQQVVVPVETRTLLWQGLNKDLHIPCYHQLWQTILSVRHIFSLILDFSCLMATGSSWVLPQVSALTPPRKNVVYITSLQNTQKEG